MPFASFKNIQKRNARLHKERSQVRLYFCIPLIHFYLAGSSSEAWSVTKEKGFHTALKVICVLGYLNTVHRDEEAKRDRMRDLKRRALTKNDDEFYFAMHSSAHSVSDLTLLILLHTRLSRDIFR